MVANSHSVHIDRFNSFLAGLIVLSPNEIGLINSIVSIRTFKKRDFLLKEGDLCTGCFFVAEGLLRNVVSNEKGEEITTYFAPENTFILEYNSYLLSTPSLFSIQALKETTVIIIDRKAMDVIHDNVREGHKLGRLLAESQFILFMRKYNSLYKSSLEERYKELNRAIPGIHNQVPQHMIASHLGITRVHLSRLKRKF